MRLTLWHSAQSQHCFFCDTVWRVWINRVLRFLLPPRTAVAWLVVPLNQQGKVKLHPALCLLMMAEQDSVFRKCKDNQGWLSNKGSHYDKRVSVSSRFACQQPIYLEMCGQGKKTKTDASNADEQQFESSWHLTRRSGQRAQRAQNFQFPEKYVLLAAHMSSLCKSYVISGSDKLLRVEKGKQVSDHWAQYMAVNRIKV